MRVARTGLLSNVAVWRRATSSEACGCRCRRNASTSTQTSEDDWEVVIGLEIHAQLRTGRKLFSKAALSYADPVNTHVELHDAAFPGTLPVVDHKAIKLSILTALALGCDVNTRSTFDRKHYFYHDIPASYQITQHYNPLARNGVLPIEMTSNGAKRRRVEVGIQQLQVEQDTAKSQLVGENRLIDLNRAGTGLMEIVTHPDMRSAEEAGAFVRRLQSLLRRVGSGDGDMEKGNLRVDANVSVRRPGAAFGTRCEIKNLNSVRFLQQAIEYERKRHIEHYLADPAIPLKQETRTMNELTGETMPLRTKEDAEDYRYMPDSNLPAMVIHPDYLGRVGAELPELPWVTVARLVEEYGITARDAETLLSLDEYAARGVKYFEQVTAGERAVGKKAANWIIHELLGQLNKAGKAWTEDAVPASLMRELVQAVEKRDITGTTGKTVVNSLISESPSPNAKLADILATLGLSPSPASADDLEEMCRSAIQAQPGIVKDIQKGKVQAVGRLVGAVMKSSQGRADATKAKEVILALISGS